MQLNRHAELAVGILVCCARAPTRQWTTRQVARINGTTKDNAAQIVLLLSRGGYLRTVRGRSGGLTLTMPPSAIRVGDVLRLVQRRLAATERATLPIADESITSFDLIVDAGFASFLRFMDRFTIADLVSGTALGRIACFDCNLVNPVRLPTVPGPNTSFKSSSASQEPFGDGTLAVGFYVSLLDGELCEITREFVRRHPKVGLELAEAPRADLAVALNNQAVDVVISNTRNGVGDASLPLWRDRILAAFRRDHPLSAKPVIEWEDLVSQTIILRRHEPGNELRTLLRAKAGDGKPLYIKHHDIGRGPRGRRRCTRLREWRAGTCPSALLTVAVLGRLVRPLLSNTCRSLRRIPIKSGRDFGAGGSAPDFGVTGVVAAPMYSLDPPHERDTRCSSGPTRTNA